MGVQIIYNPNMDQLLKAVLAGIIFGGIAAGSMIPLDFSSISKKREAMLAGFIERFMIAFVIVLINLPLPHPLAGFILGFLMSLPTAIITRKYIPLLAMGSLGGFFVGLFT